MRISLLGILSSTLCLIRRGVGLDLALRISVSGLDLALRSALTDAAMQSSTLTSTVSDSPIFIPIGHGKPLTVRLSGAWLIHGCASNRTSIRMLVAGGRIDVFRLSF